MGGAVGICVIVSKVLDITRAEDVMADNSPSTRAQPKDGAIIAIISEVTRYNYFIPTY